MRRRAFLFGSGSVLAVGDSAEGDQELLALGRELERLRRRCTRLRRKMERLDGKMEYDLAWSAWSEMIDRTSEVSASIHGRPVATLAGLQVKYQAIVFDLVENESGGFAPTSETMIENFAILLSQVANVHSWRGES